MTPYVIALYNEDGSLLESRSCSFTHDDDAIDYAGEIDHLYEMKIWQGARLMAHFAPKWPRGIV